MYDLRHAHACNDLFVSMGIRHAEISLRDGSGLGGAVPEDCLSECNVRLSALHALIN